MRLPRPHDKGRADHSAILPRLDQLPQAGSLTGHHIPSANAEKVQSHAIDLRGVHLSVAPDKVSADHERNRQSDEANARPRTAVRQTLVRLQAMMPLEILCRTRQRLI